MRNHLSTRALQAVLMLIALGASGTLSFAQSKTEPQAEKPKISRQSFTYKKVEKQELIADVYRQDDDKVRPIVLQIPGGALMGGGRYMEPAILDWFLENGFVLVSFDYRLAPF